MSKVTTVVSKVDAVVQKVEQYALVVVGGGIAASSEVDPSKLPHKEGAILLAVVAGLTAIKPYLTKAVTVTEKYNPDNTVSTVATVVNRATSDVKHVEQVVKADVVQVKTVAEDVATVVKDEVHQAPAATQTAVDDKAVADAKAARAQLEAQATAAKAALASAEAQLNAIPPVPGGPAGV